MADSGTHDDDDDEDGWTVLRATGGGGGLTVDVVAQTVQFLRFGMKVLLLFNLMVRQDCRCDSIVPEAEAKATIRSLNTIGVVLSCTKSGYIR